MRLGAFAMALLLGITAGREALATSCVELPADYSIAPGTIVPANARPKMLVRRADPTPAYSLVCSKDGSVSGPVAIDMHDLGGEPFYALEIVPREPLPVGAACAVVTEHAWSTWFSIADAKDETPPRAVTRDAPIGFRNENFLAEVYVPLEHFDDDTAKPVDLVAAVWTTTPEESIRYDSPPTSWARIVPNRDRDEIHGSVALTLGGTCGERWFDFPPYGETRKVGIVLVDPAGNRSKPIELSMDGAPNAWQVGQMTDREMANLRARPLAPFVEKPHRKRGWLALGLLLVAVVAWVLFLERDQWIGR